MLHVVADGIWLSEQRGKCLRAMEGIYAAGTEFDIVVIGKARQLVRRLIDEANAIVDRHPFERAVRIARGLPFNCRDILARIFFFRLRQGSLQQ